MFINVEGRFSSWWSVASSQRTATTHRIEYSLRDEDEIL